MNAAEASAARAPAPEPRRREERDSDPAAAANLASPADSRWFAQLLGGEAQGGSGALAGLAGLQPGALDALVEQLAPRLQQAADASLQALLHLPQLGRVSVSARRLRDEGWDISLQAEDDDGQACLVAAQTTCAERLGEALGRPVALHVQEVAT